MGFVRAIYQFNADGQVLRVRFVWEVVPFSPDTQRGYVPRHILDEHGYSPNAPIGTLLELGDLKMRVLGTNIMCDAYEVELESIHARWTAFVRPLRDVVEMIYRRGILTLAVWGHAECTLGNIPSWRDVYLFQRLARYGRK